MKSDFHFFGGIWSWALGYDLATCAGLAYGLAYAHVAWPHVLAWLITIVQPLSKSDRKSLAIVVLSRILEKQCHRWPKPNRRLFNSHLPDCVVYDGIVSILSFPVSRFNGVCILRMLDTIVWQGHCFGFSFLPGTLFPH